MQKSHTNSVKYVYNQTILGAILDAAKDNPVSKDGNENYSAFQREIISKALKGFSYQFCSISTATLSPANELTAITSVNLDLPDEQLMKSYIDNHQYDIFTPLVYANLGRALCYTHSCTQERLIEQPFFKNHCSKFGIYHGISVGYMYPGHENTSLVFDYMGDKNNTMWAAFDHVKLELITFPFALAWLYRFKKMDLTHLEKNFFYLSGLTEARLLNLRKYICAKDQNLEAQARDLGVSKATYQESLSFIRDSIFSKTGKRPKHKKYIPLRVLDEYYGFLRMMCDHTKELMPPKASPFLSD